MKESTNTLGMRHIPALLLLAPPPGGRAGETSEPARLAHFAALVAHSDDAIVSKTLDGIVCSWNAGAERIFGYTAAEMVGQSILKLIPPERHHEEHMILARMRAGDHVDHYETERIRKDGQYVPVSLSVSPIRDEHGRIVGASKIARDISERRSAERQVAEKQSRLEAEAQALTVLHDWSSRLWRCRSLDEGMQHILDAMIELSRADFGNVQLREGEVLRFAAHRGLDQAFLDVFRAVSERDESGCARAMRLRRRVTIADTESDAAYAPYREAARRAGYRTLISLPLLASADEVLGVVTVQFRHIHEPSEAEFRRMDLCARQASEFVQRCRMEQQLREADRRKDDFLAVLAHELRNPLAPIKSGVSLLKADPSDASLRARTLAVVDRQVEHVGRLVDDLLDASRVGRGKVTLQLQWLDLGSLLLHAIETSRPQIEAARHRLGVDVPQRPVWMHGDPVQLTQVFVNLLNNASKYTPDGGAIAVELELEGTMACASISDNGMGIAANMLDRIFDLFVQADEEDLACRGGLGIGLSLVRSLVRMHDGTVQVFSDGPGFGSRFTVCLPLGRSPDVPRSSIGRLLRHEGQSNGFPFPVA